MKNYILIVCILCFSGLFADDITPIASIQDSIGIYEGQTVTIEGIVTIGADILRTDRLTAYIQDSSQRGLQIYDSSTNSGYRRDIIRGNKLKITGEITEYNGTTEITDFSYEVIESGVAVDNIVSRYDFTTAANFAKYEGSMVELKGLVSDKFTAGGGVNITITDSVYAEYAVRIWNTANVNSGYIKENNRLIVMGVVSSYEGSPQLLLGYQEDLLNLNKPMPYIAYSPKDPFLKDSLRVFLPIKHENKIVSADLYYSTSEAENKVFYSTAMHKTNEAMHTFSAWLPVIKKINPKTEFIYVYIQAQDDLHNTFTSGVFRIKIYNGKPDIQSVEFTSPAIKDYVFVNYPFNNEPIKINAAIIDHDGSIAEAKLYYGTATGGYNPDPIIMTIKDHHYSGEIPSLMEQTGYNCAQEVIYYIEATDNEDKTNRTEEYRIEVGMRAPVFYSLDLEYTPNVVDTLPENDSLAIKVRIQDTEGEIVESSCKLIYSLDYSKSKYSVPLVKHPSIPNLFTGTIRPQSSGVTVHITCYAEDDSANASVDYPSNKDVTLEYTYPVLTHKAILKVPAKAFNPYQDETIPIDYYSKRGDKAILRIYSAEGKLVHTPKNAILSAEDGINRYEWNGKNRMGSILPVGLYICHLEVTEVATGNKKTDKAPIVIGVPLK